MIRAQRAQNAQLPTCTARYTAGVRGLLQLGSAQLVPGMPHSVLRSPHPSSRDERAMLLFEQSCPIVRRRHHAHKPRVQAQRRRAAAASSRGGICSMYFATSEQPAVDGDVGEDRRHGKLQALPHWETRARG